MAAISGSGFRRAAAFSFANGRQPPPGEVAIEADDSEPAAVPGEA